MVDSSASRVKKTFSLKKRGEEETAEEIAIAEALQPEFTPEEQKKINQELQYDGEIFEQYYRPLSVTDKEAGLTKLANEPIAQPEALAPAPKAVREIESAEIREAAEALTHQLYKLAQKLRETDLDVYLSAFNVILGSRSCRHMKELLDYGNAFFTEHYYTLIRERGERPEIFHQIIKRTGHETAERIAKIVRGLDVEALAKTLWDLYHGADPEKVSKITGLLLDCTPKQVRALREEFVVIPYRDLAQQLWTVLHRGDGAEAIVKKTIGRLEIQETRKRTAARSRDEAAAVIYLLNGRTAEEIGLIRFFYDAIAADSDLPLGIEETLRKRLQPMHLKAVLKILAGWNAVTDAEEIHGWLYPLGMEKGYDDTLSETRDLAELDFNTGLLPFNRKFKKRKIVRTFERLEDRIFAVYELIEEKIAPLSPSQFAALNEVLASRHGYMIPAELFQSRQPFDARRRALALSERLESAREVWELLRPLMYLTPKQALATTVAFKAFTGFDLDKEIRRKAADFQGGSLTPELEYYVEIHLNGHARWPLNLDLLARYRGEEPEPDVWDIDYIPDQATEHATLHIAEIVNTADAHEVTLEKLRQILASKDYRKRSQIERTFYEMSDPQTPLLLSLDGGTHGAEEERLRLLLAGYDADAIVNAISADPRKVMTLLRGAPKSLVDFVRNVFEARTGIDTIAFVEREISEGPELLDICSVLLCPDVFRYREILGDMRKDKTIYAEEFRAPWTWPISRRMAFERAYDTLFPRLRVHLKAAAGRNALQAREFADSILYFEGVEPSVIEKIVEHFDAIDIGGLLEVLSDHRHDQNVIEECYDLLNDENTLRRSVKAMQVPLDKINETLLHIEGFYPKDVAHEIEGLLQSLSKTELGVALLDLVAVPEEGKPNHRIPTDINWTDEMTRQISLAYQQLYGRKVMDVLREQEVPLDLLEKINERVFGHDIAGFARDVYMLIRANIDGTSNTEQEEERVANFIEMRGARYRELIVQAYKALWEHLPDMGVLLEDIAKHLKHPIAKKRLINLLGGAPAAKPGQPPGPALPAQAQT